MVQFQKYLQKTNDFQNGRNLPLLNSLFTDRFSQFNPYSDDNNFKTYMKWARRSPQLIGFLNIIATDILSDSRRFIPLNKESGRNKIRNAKSFWEDNDGLEVIEETIYDMLLAGIGFNWLGKLEEVQLKEFCLDVLDEMKYPYEKKEKEIKAERMVEDIKVTKPDKIVKKLRHVAASTMTIQTDEYEVLNYVQRVGVNVKPFSKEEILTFKLMPFDGKVYPFPPMEALLAEIYLLWLITQGHISFFENGGKPDAVFILPKEMAGSPNHQLLIDTLKKYKKIQNKHGNLVFTGEIQIEQLMKVEQQMENKELGLYIVGVLAMTYGIPVSRIPFLIGKAANNGDAGGLADSGYWRKISVWQNKIETVYNKSLFRPYFGVEFQFSRSYLQDEVRETQTEMQKTQIAEQRMKLGLWTSQKAGEYLGIDSEEIKRAQKESEQKLIKSGMLLQNNLNNKQTIPNDDARRKAAKKQQTQNNNKTNNGGKTLNP